MPLDSNGIWTYTEDDPISPASTLLNRLSESTSNVVTALRGQIAGLITDTGWQTISVRTPHAQQGTSAPSVRRIGRVVYARWGWAPAGLVASTIHIVGDVPAGFRPSQTCYLPAVSGSPGGLGVLVVYSDGRIELRPGSPVREYYLFPAHVTWLVD